MPQKVQSLLLQYLNKPPKYHSRIDEYINL